MIPRDNFNLFDLDEVPEGTLVNDLEGEEESEGNESDDEFHSTIYMERAAKKLIKQFLSSKVQVKVLDTGMSKYQRKIIHECACMFPVSHESEGLGKDRRIVLRKLHQDKTDEAVPEGLSLVERVKLRKRVA